MIEELQTYIHREVSDLRGDIVRQFCEQERIIQEQREQIEMLTQLLQQKRCSCLFGYSRGNSIQSYSTQKLNSDACRTPFCLNQNFYG